jgi:signal transduction histidine kinase
MSQEFVAGAGGTVEVESERGRGTRVRLLFPAMDEARATAAV